MNAPLTPIGDVATPAPSATELAAFDPVALLLADKRSLATKRAYACDLAVFFESGGYTPAPADVQAFLSLAAPQIALRLATWKGEMLTAGLSEATVNRRLAAVRSLLKFSHRLGLTQTDGRGLVDSEKAHAYRDTRGTDIHTLRRLLGVLAKTYT